MSDARYDAVKLGNEESHDESEAIEKVTELKNDKTREIPGLKSTGNRRRNKVGLIPVRYQLALLSFIGLTCIGAMRQNMSVAMVAMVNTTYTGYKHTDDLVKSNEEVSSCKVRDNNTEYADETSGEFFWNTHTQELLLAGFFYGYLCTQIPGGWMSDRFGMKWVLGLGILLSSVSSILGPWAARMGPVFFFITRFLAGLGEGVVLPAVASMWSHWAHPYERSRLGVTTTSGLTFGSIISSIVGGYLVRSDIMGGWPFLFYVLGTVGCIWFVLWCVFVSSQPSNHRWISRQEREYLENNLKIQSKISNKSIPWLSILSSPVVWVLMLCQLIQGWGLFTIVTNLPLYYTKGLGLSVEQAGVYSAIPYALQLICNFVSAFVADVILSRKYLGLSHTRKLITATSFGGCAVFLACAGFARCNTIASVTLMTLSVGINGAAYSGYYVSMIDVAGSYAGSVTALANGAGGLGGVIGPLVVGELTEVQSDIFGWQSVLWILASLYSIAALVYTLVASSKLQPWARTTEFDRNGSMIHHEDL
ncbi:sialin-like isoform X1 [Lytechinus pictus]|uniref:sialin-like isoform X1 n=1 Tax=Lytechinus pictus TaxID=7653 RepID=UPI0030BA17C0